MKLINSFAAILFLSSFHSFAQSDTIKTTLQEVVITATKTETPYYTLASSVSIITSEEISRRQLNTVVDILREMPGLFITQQGGPGKISNIYMRGTNPNNTLVIVDGTEMNDPSSPNNAFDLSTLNTNDIKRIEIVRGPQSTLYGSDAMAGVINIITKRGGNLSKYTVNGEVGSNKYYRANLSAEGSFVNLNYFLSFSRNSSDGISTSNSKYGNHEKDSYYNNALTANLNYSLSSNISFDFLYKLTKAETDLDQNEKLGDDPNFSYNIEEQIFKGGSNFTLFDNSWEQKLNITFIKRFGNTIDLIDELHPKFSFNSYNRAERLKFDWQNNFRFIPDNLITFGIETETEKAYTSFFSESEWGPYESVFPEQSLQTTSIYLQDQIKISNSFFASIGFRYDDNKKYGGVTTFRIAPSYFISSTSTKIKATYGTGFKAPSLYSIFDPLYGNPNLKPEKSKGWDFGIEQYLLNGKITFGMTYFNLRMENMFGFDANYRAINIAKASSKGIEISVSAFNIEKFSVSTNYTFTETKDEYEGTDDFGKPLIRRPKHQFSASLDYQLNNELNICVQMRYVGEREDKDFSVFPASRVIMPDYTIVNLSASYKLFEHMQLKGRVENLLSKEYEEVLYYGTLGRSVYFGIQIDL